jgi:hypothetical protein
MLTPTSGSTISRNFAGCAVDTSTHCCRTAGPRAARVRLCGGGRVRTPDAPIAQVVRADARAIAVSSIDTADSAP